MYRRSDSPSLIERVVEYLDSRTRRIQVLVAFSYISGISGIGVAFVGGMDEPTSRLATVGIVLLAVSFACLFYVSVTLLAIDEGV